MSSDMGSNNLFDPMLDKLIEPGSPTRDRTQSSNPMSDKPIEPGLSHTASDRIVQSLVGQACPTQHWTIVSDAVLDKPTGWVYFSGAAKGGDEPAKDSIDKEDNPSDIIELLRSRKGKSELEYYLNQKKKERESGIKRGSDKDYPQTNPQHTNPLPKRPQKAPTTATSHSSGG
ncbi:hypothetical protein PCANC_05915 [Puccinia coronata f. sp. avenae]|uniref:Uncharacterized protein n=1 Tax=Puccinia coronata f. sp. avenae TaxID=200324 RepID=A0A2N5VY50_9BASI|nr:hypothetical protein PCANC_05915 [Puccinia coronata f. sp. avenae]